jgi:hypothetical protein
MPNFEQFIKQVQDATLRVIEVQQSSIQTAMFTLQADYLQRIFKEGEDSDNNKIGQYSTKPFYAGKGNSQVRSSSIKPKGKNGETKFKNGKQRKTQYMAGGYKEFRSVVGRQNTKVDLALTFALRGSIQVGIGSNGSTLSFNSDKELAKARGNEKRFNKTIFDASRVELDKLVTNYQSEVEEAFFSAFKP